MILHPSILSLTIGSVVVGWIVIFASIHAVRILRCWDLESGSEGQLALERKTYLVTTVLSWGLGFQLVSLFYFLSIADHLSDAFAGAMCAAGSLGLNDYGYPALLLKVGNFLGVGAWLILNHTDNRAPDYPLLKVKYLLLLILAPALLAEAAVQGLYFASLQPDVITSCCGSLFGGEASAGRKSLFTLPREGMRVGYYGAMLATLGAGVDVLMRDRPASGYRFAAAGSATFAVSIAAFISYMCLYIYELPTHHCPFCVLHGQYGYLGYPLFGCLLGGAVFTLGVGALAPFRRVQSLVACVPALQGRLVVGALVLYGTFASIMAWHLANSQLTL